MITVIILTYNEAKHLERCIDSLRPLSPKICVVDSYSTDETQVIAERLGVEFYVNPWVNYATQFNWALNNCKIDTPWVMRMDADEYILPELADEIILRLPKLLEQVTGCYVSRRVIFKGHWLRYGGFYPVYLLRIWRNSVGHCEQRLMDEHIVLNRGDVVKFQNDLVDDNLNDIHWWTNKHNNYARREAADLINLKFSLTNNSEEIELAVRQARVKRFLKNTVYQNLPLGIRPMLYFLFRFFFQMGILDGPKGWVFHFLQGFWYRFLVDINVWEFCMNTKNFSKEQMLDYLSEEWNIHLREQCR